jgi:hypothetical protein
VLLRYYHTIVPTPVLEMLRPAMARIGLLGTDWSGIRAIFDTLEKHGIIPRSSFRPDPRLRAFTSPVRNDAVLWLVNDWPWSVSSLDEVELDILVIRPKGNPDELALAVSQALRVRLLPNTIGALAYGSRCTRKVTGPSPNGRALRDPRVREACERAVTDSHRIAVRTAASSGDRMKYSSEDYRAVEQGLWLEWLTYETLNAYSGLVWHGVMSAGQELDALAVFNENILLAECKDTSFGHNDFVVALHKANLNSADLLLVVTTQPLHANVLSAIERHLDPGEEEEGYTDRLPCAVVVVSELTGDALRASLNREIGSLASHALKNWLTGRRVTMASYRYYETSDLVPL